MKRRLSINKLIQFALKEDIGKGDITTQLVVPKKKEVTAAIIAKEKGILAGIAIARQVFRAVNRNLKFVTKKKDGAKLTPGNVIALVKGDAGAILTAERVAVNFLQHLSGVATLTNKFVNAVRGAKALILDTRKTIPGLRELEKYAVIIGGGKNHRFGLDDMILIKNNHIIAAGSLRAAIIRAKQVKPKGLKIEVETKNLNEIKIALSQNIKLIMLDNMSLKEMRMAVKLGGAKYEASGGVNLKNVGAVAKTGVDYISVGALTHSAKALDISLKILR
jgi:nicotinate-nucleotide pyrophosphorylase (carboxylating)